MRYICSLTLCLTTIATPLKATELADEDDVSISVPVALQTASVAEPPVEESRGALQLLGAEVQPGEFGTLYWKPVQSFQSIDTPVPVLVAHGQNPGPRVCLTAAIHGDELNGIEMVRRMMYQLEPATMTGTVIGIPIVNLDGFRRGSRYLADRRDLNRHFPGSPTGSAADRTGHSLFNNVISQCQFLVDLHTGSLQRTNLPQIRGNLKDEHVFDFTRQFGGITVLHGVGAKGTLRRAANDIGIPAVTMEAGGPNQLDEDAVDAGVQSIETLLQNLGIQKSKRFWSAPQPVFYQSDWVRADQGGILMSKVKLGDKVRKGQVLGSVIDPVSNSGSAILAPFDGKILGIAFNQVVQTGFATHHIGVEKAPQAVQEDAIERDLTLQRPAASGDCVADIGTESATQTGSNISLGEC
ncbi:MAG: succinylglutamate desuccinylase/aspartoacylase family protein [Alcanivoracaceae bacterium]|jgi:predicted deacylase|nr:succinylglutamate desuccinylase/aspartoacylase family protein [Alcanivoracaceae bacterium]